MTTQHTPGPWKIIGHGIHGKSGFRVCHIPSGYLSALANAHLITAAPELLEALMKARCYVDDTIKENRPLLKEIDAIIAKARGQV